MKTTIKYLLILIGFAANAQLEFVETNYSYDSLNRLVQVVFNDDSTHDYVYDDLGNRTQLNIETLSIDLETLQNAITVYPNPTDSFLNIKFPDYLRSQKIALELYDVNGRLVKNHSSEIQNDSVKVNVQTLSDGVYLLHFIGDDKKWSKLFIKK